MKNLIALAGLIWATCVAGVLTGLLVTSVVSYIIEVFTADPI